METTIERNVVSSTALET